MVIQRGSVWWADLGVSGVDDYLLEGERPVIVIQADSLNRSRLQTVLVVPLTANADRAQAVGNLLLSPAETGLPVASVAVPSQLRPLARRRFRLRLGALSATIFEELLFGVDIVLGCHDGL